jgi:hypothetical protein
MRVDIGITTGIQMVKLLRELQTLFLLTPFCHPREQL